MKPVVEKEYSELATQGVDGILSFFEAACQSLEFSQQCANLGFADSIYHPNDWNTKNRKGQSSGYKKFAQCLEASSSVLLASHAKLALVFHGTATENIASILKEGLDERRRSQQAYGEGEYFAKMPASSEFYCKGGLEMLVFVVVLPTVSNQYAPNEYVIVKNNQHHVAIGTLQYKNVELTVDCASQCHRRRYLGLHMQIATKSLDEKETCAKGTIVQELLLHHPDVASELYKSCGSILSEVSKREISWYVHLKLKRQDDICRYFPGLPEPMTLETALNLRAQTLSKAGEPRPQELQHLARPSTVDLTGPLLSLPPAMVVPPSYTYITSAGQRAFRIPPMKPVNTQTNYVKQRVLESSLPLIKSDEKCSISHPRQNMAKAPPLAEVWRIF